MERLNKPAFFVSCLGLLIACLAFTHGGGERVTIACTSIVLFSVSLVLRELEGWRKL